MILIADSGSTKCSWALCDNNGNLIKEITTIGFNPYFIDNNSIQIHLEQSQLKQYKEQITEIFFYGAGCSSKQKNKIIQAAFKIFFKNAKITINHDLDAACLAMYNGTPNITCILGTGSNSCFYNGKKIIESAPSLGFIMGDEASGNYFGKKILNLYYNNLMPNELKQQLESEFETDISVVNKNIYNSDRPNVFLAKYFPFIVKTKTHPLIQKLIKNSINDFFNLHVKCFNNYHEVETNFIGSVAFFLSEEIHTTAKNNNLKIGKILQNPIKRLIEFHTDKIKTNKKRA